MHTFAIVRKIYLFPLVLMRLKVIKNERGYYFMLDKTTVPNLNTTCILLNSCKYLDISICMMFDNAK